MENLQAPKTPGSNENLDLSENFGLILDLL